MSATNHTTNYELPIFVGSDKPAWLVDWNGAMTAIDTAIHTAEGKADQAGTDIGGIESSISTINSTLTSINNAVSQLRIDTNANTGNINTINSLIGNGTPTTTDKTLIGAINELHQDIQEIETLDVYTSTEQIIGEWTDGKTIYRKVYEGSASSNGATLIPDSLKATDIDTLINATCTVSSASGVKCPSYSTGSSDDYLRVYMSNTGTTVAVGSSYPPAPYSYVVILEYTK